MRQISVYCGFQEGRQMDDPPLAKRREPDQ